MSHLSLPEPYEVSDALDWADMGRVRRPHTGLTGRSAGQAQTIPYSLPTRFVKIYPTHKQVRVDLNTLFFRRHITSKNNNLRLFRGKRLPGRYLRLHNSRKHHSLSVLCLRTGRKINFFHNWIKKELCLCTCTNWIYTPVHTPYRQTPNTLSRPPQPQSEKLVPQIPANVYGGNRPSKTLG